MEKKIKIGDIVSDSGMGAGTITGFNERGFPMVNNVTCAWIEFEDGSKFDPYGVSESTRSEGWLTQPNDVKLLNNVRLKFKSGNEIPVLEARVTRQEFEAIERLVIDLTDAVVLTNGK